MSYVDANPESESTASDEQELHMQGKGRDRQMGAMWSLPLDKLVIQHKGHYCSIM